MKFYNYIPHYSGVYGENTVYVGKRSDHPCVVSHLHYEFNRWPMDDFLGCTFHFIGTERLRQALEALQPPVTGIEFDQVEISGDEQEFKRVWREGRPDSALGKWYWFKITGQAGRDDFGGKPSRDLVISERVLDTLNRYTTEKSVREFCEWNSQGVTSHPE
ncbi:MAG: hypothetical protein QG574_4242 [Cyanobacteriota bacterium erpe_2018_sw_21hr_WHONDRS-SW48-000092_B_bin.40]|nr:hypothetical protein [Cyanobacteriota bacterium erpe_2018_sw_21hr_WHONDRS-SW48-000092_B_bin.40]